MAKKKTNLICTLFGHKTPWYGATRFMRIEPSGWDSVGRSHGRIIAACNRCGCEYQVGTTHIPNPELCVAQVVDEDQTKPRRCDMLAGYGVGRMYCKYHRDVKCMADSSAAPSDELYVVNRVQRLLKELEAPRTLWKQIEEIQKKLDEIRNETYGEKSA